jgi:AcrR family transcriptional regulator
MSLRSTVRRQSARTATANKTAKAPERAASDRRLTSVDWIEAGQDILREQGIAGVKLAALTARLGVSTGSFYHHFSDFEDYLGAVARHFSADRVRRVLEQTMVGNPDPITRIQRLAKLSLQERTFELDHAMRIWATMDPRAAATVSESESLVLPFLTQAFRDLGFETGEADVRARILLSVNVAPLLVFNKESRRDFFKQALETLTRRP